jgi:hypothetical protein
LKKKIWLFVGLVVILITQLAALSSFFHPFQTEGFTYNNSIIEISMGSYVFGWASLQISGATSQNPVTLQFPNGSQMVLTSDYTFKMKFPRTGDCFCSAGTSLFGTNVALNESQPIVAAVVANASSFEIDSIPKNGTLIDDGLFDVYWFVLVGDASVYINGYGVSY